MASSPHAVIAKSGLRAKAITWDLWIAKNPIIKHAGAADPRLRLAEPDESDVSGRKYRIDCASDARLNKRPGRPLTLTQALEALVERENHDDRIVALGSNRPIVFWKIPEGLRTHMPCVYWPGASVRESTVVLQSPLIQKRSREMVLLRVRCRRFTKDRIERASEYERILLGEVKVNEAERRGAKPLTTPRVFGRKSNLSAFCLGAILERCETIENAQAAANQFTGPVRAG